MLTIGKSTMLGAAFLAGVAIAACQQPPCGASARPRNAATESVASYTAAAVDRPRRVLRGAGLMRGIPTMTDPALFSLARSEMMSLPGIWSAITAIVH
jgi:hypothetical protein